MLPVVLPETSYLQLFQELETRRWVIALVVRVAKETEHVLELVLKFGDLHSCEVLLTVRGALRVPF
jgi:hypothetical protein